MNFLSVSKFWQVTVCLLLFITFHCTLDLKGEIEGKQLESLMLTGKLVIDIGNIQPSVEDEYLIPVYYEGGENVESLDMNFKFDSEKLNITSIEKAVDGLQMFPNIDEDNHTIIVSGFILGSSIEPEQHLFYLVTPNLPAEVTIDCFDFSTGYGLVNGESVDVEIAELTTNIEEMSFYFSIHPNPTSKRIQVFFRGNEAVDYSLFDYTGKLLLQSKVNHVQKAPFQIDTESYPSGVYLFNIYSTNTGKLLAKEKIVIAH